MKIEPSDQGYDYLGEEWPSRNYRLPDQSIVTLDVASDSRLSEWSYFWLTFCTGGVRPAWYRVFEKGKQPPEWQPLKSSVKRVLKQTSVDDDEENPTQARREREGKVGVAEKLPAGQYVFEVKFQDGGNEYELAGIEFKVKAAPKPDELQFSLTRPQCSASAVVSLIKLPKPAVRGLVDVAGPFKFNDFYPEYLRVNGQQVAEYPWPGIFLVTLLPYLREKHQVTLTKSEHDKVTQKITEKRKTPQYIFTEMHRQAFLDKLNGQFSEQEMRDYFREYNGTDDPEAGKKMRDGIQALRQSLNTLDKNSVILLCVG